MNWLTNLLTTIASGLSPNKETVLTTGEAAETLITLGSQRFTFGELSAAFSTISKINFKEIDTAFKEKFSNLSDDAIIVEGALEIAGDFGLPEAGWLEDGVKVLAFLASHSTESSTAPPNMHPVGQAGSKPTGIA